MSLKAEIRSKIAEFDRRSPSVLGETEAQFGRERGYLTALIGLAGDQNAPVSSGSTWLIKSHLEAGGSLSPSQVAKLLGQLDLIKEWDAQLHICQSVRLLTIAGAEVALLAIWLTPLMSNSRPFLRAWSLDAVCRLAAEHPLYDDLAQKALAAGLDDGAASVRARARRLQKELHELKS